MINGGQIGGQSPSPMLSAIDNLEQKKSMLRRLSLASANGLNVS